MDKAKIVQIVIRLPEFEKQRLEKHCGKIGRSQTDVLRELIRSLPDEDDRV